MAFMTSMTSCGHNVTRLAFWFNREFPAERLLDLVLLCDLWLKQCLNLLTCGTFGHRSSPQCVHVALCVMDVRARVRMCVCVCVCV